LSENQAHSSVSLKVGLGQIEITIQNCPSNEFNQAVRNALEAIDSNLELTMRLAEKFGASRSQKGSIRPLPMQTDIANLSIAEVVRKSGAKKGTDLTLVVAFYLLKAEGQEVVNTKDLNDAFDKARLSKLGNLSQTLSTLVQSGRMNETQEKDNIKGFKITQTGEDEVRQMLEPNP